MSWKKVGVLGLVIAVALTAYAAGAGSKSSLVVVLCASKQDRDVTLAKAGKCSKGAKSVTVGKSGPAGSVGLPGPAGAPGAPSATLAVEPPHLVTNAVVACAANPGSFCVTQSGLCYRMGNFEPGQALASYRRDPAGFVHLTGAVRNFEPQGACGSSESNPVFYLPPGFRPSGGTQRFTAPLCTGLEGSAIVIVAASGLVSSTSNCPTPRPRASAG